MIKETNEERELRILMDQARLGRKWAMYKLFKDYGLDGDGIFQDATKPPR